MGSLSASSFIRAGAAAAAVAASVGGGSGGGPPGGGTGEQQTSIDSGGSLQPLGPASDDYSDAAIVRDQEKAATLAAEHRVRAAELDRILEQNPWR